jgi:DNA-binding PadR family transcriptional regulator
MVSTITTDELTGPMPTFLMATISRGGLKTLYALQQAAGLQPGSLAHVIKALLEAGFLVRSDVAKRGRRAMALTEAGERFLVEEWRKSMDAGREIESVLRSATVALLMGDIGEASRFLSESITRRPPLQSHQELETISPQETPINFHTAMRTFYLNQRRTMEISVLERIADNLRRSAAT